MSKKRECYLCGAKYHYCPTCSNDKLKPAWMAEFHSESCKNIFDICTRFNLKRLTKAEAQDALKECDLSNKEKFKDYVQRDLENIFAAEPKAKRGKRVEIKPVDDAIVELVDEAIVEPMAIEPESHEVVNKTEE